MSDLSRLAAALRAHGHEALARLPFHPLPTRGVAHDHVAIEGSGLLLRLPRLSQWSQGSAEALAYQAACFTRAAPSGHTPQLAGILAPGPDLPRGALLVEAIAGHLPRLPANLTAIAQALASIHALPLPSARAPLIDQSRAGGPYAATLAGVEAHAAFLPRAGLHRGSAALLLEELAAAHRPFPSEPPPEPVRLVGTDTHPGNYLLAGDRAIFVDLEKALYGAPAIDLAHATLPTSTLWDREIALELSPTDTATFYRAWCASSTPALVAASRPWFVPARRLTWLRTLFWAVRWRVLSAEDDAWSPERVGPSLARHMTETVEHLLHPDTLHRMHGTVLELPPE